MATLSPHVIKSQKSVDRLNEKYDSLFKDSNIVKDGITTYDDHSSDEEALTQGQVLPPPLLSELVGGPQSAARDNPVSRYTKQFGNARRPREADVELGLKTTDYTSQQDEIVQPGPNAAEDHSPSTAKAFEILHNWTQVEKDDEIVSYINVIERKASSANEIISSIRGHIGWLLVDRRMSPYEYFLTADRHSEDSVQSLQKFKVTITCPWYIKFRGCS